MSIWIAQCLCPSRHSILALAFDEGELSVAQAKARLAVHVERGIEAGTLDPWCGICGSRAFEIEAGRTPFPSMDAARPHLEMEERANRSTREFYAAIRRAWR